MVKIKKAFGWFVLIMGIYILYRELLFEEILKWKTNDITLSRKTKIMK